MERHTIVDTLLKNIDNLHELGRQRAFELGNPFYAQFKEDGEYWRKELPTGEKFLVTFDIIFDDNGIPIEVKDTFLKEIDS
ncbi:MAG TPA: hypothetical protein VIM16_10895 [Mucilaginibacter sp.]|jgi:hypothetical protein